MFPGPQFSHFVGPLRVEPEVVNSFSSVFPIPQVIPVSNFRPLSLLVFILWRFEISNLFDSD